MFYDYIEIGTSDFDSEIQKKNNKGISIEPIKYYIDRLPNKTDCIKLQNAISNYNGYVNVFYLNEENIKKYNLPKWVRGCNSINSVHPTVKKLLQNKNIDIDQIITIEKVPCKTLFNILIEHNISTFHFLKIDTEGHDCIILENFYNDISNNNLYYPNKILFETNVLSNPEYVNKIIKLYNNIGYDLKQRSTDTILQLNLDKLNNKKTFIKYENYLIQNNMRYNITNLPYENNFESAQKYCIDNNFNGINLIDNIYHVTNGKYVINDISNKTICWVYK